MGLLYHIEPLNDEVAELMEAMGAAVPKSAKPSRNPTPAEIRDVCADLSGFHTEFNSKPKSFWQALITGNTKSNREEGTILNIDKFTGNEKKPHTIWFEKGSPAVILEILKQLSKQCGPL